VSKISCGFAVEDKSNH